MLDSSFRLFSPSATTPDIFRHTPDNNIEGSSGINAQCWRVSERAAREADAASALKARRRRDGAHTLCHDEFEPPRSADGFHRCLPCQFCYCLPLHAEAALIYFSQMLFANSFRD